MIVGRTSYWATSQNTHSEKMATLKIWSDPELFKNLQGRTLTEQQGVSVLNFTKNMAGFLVIYTLIGITRA